MLKELPIADAYDRLQFVLILVLVEHAQRVVSSAIATMILRLNPCFSGTCSKSVPISTVSDYDDMS